MVTGYQYPFKSLAKLTRLHPINGKPVPGLVLVLVLGIWAAKCVPTAALLENNILDYAKIPLCTSWRGC